MNKRGITFTYITLMFLILILLLFSIYTKSKTRYEVEVTTATSENIDNFINKLESEYIPAAVRVSLSRAVFAIEKEIKDSGSYVNGAPGCLKHVMIEGMYRKGDCGSNDDFWMSDMTDEGVNYTFENLARQLEFLAEMLGIELHFEDVGPDQTHITQEDAWTLGVEFEVTYSVYHNFTNVSWEGREFNEMVNVSIDGFYSPVHAIYGSENEVIITKHPDRSSIPLNDVELGEALNERYFYENKNAPHFLAMLEGDFSGSKKGICSFVHKNNYPDIGVSWTDFNYFVRGQGYSEENCIIPIGTAYPPGYPEYCFSDDDWNNLFK